MASPFETQTARDVSGICVETVPPVFSEWVVDINAAADKVDIRNEKKAWKKPSIYRVTNFARSHNPNAFTPQVISFGPFHHGAENLKVTEVHKHRALAHFLHRAKKRSDPFISKLRCILKQLQDSYQGLDEYWKANPYEFLKMMLLDGCFMIEVLRLEEYSQDYASNDPVFSSQMMPLRTPYIKRDMLLLENQLPLLVLKALLEVENLGQNGDQYINNLVLKFCGDGLQAKLEGLACHPLELYRMSLLYGHDEMKIVDCVPGTFYEPKVIQHVVELRKSGVDFKRNERNTGLRAISFNSKTGWLELPYIPVDDLTEYLFLNMVAYEQIHVGISNEITSYVTFMDALIDTEADVQLLHKKEIINNSLGSYKAIADLFNNLGKETALNPKDKLNKVRNLLSGYCKNKRNRWWATLWHEHLRTPWKVAAIIFAALVFLLTFLQTLYSILSFHLGK